jgi:hypothetical protein
LYCPGPKTLPDAPPTPGDVPPGDPFAFKSPPLAVPPTPTGFASLIAVAPNAVAIVVPALSARTVLPPTAPTVNWKLVVRPVNGA